MRARIRVAAEVGRDPERLKAAALAEPSVAERLAGKTLVKAIAVPEKLVSLVVK